MSKERIGENIVTDYEVMFAGRTGLTILLPKNPVFNETPAFTLDSNGREVLVKGPKGSLTLKNLKKDYVDEAVERGFIMFYETEDDEVIRCTACQYSKN